MYRSSWTLLLVLRNRSGDPSLLFAAATAGLRLRRRVQSDAAAVGEVDALRPHQTCAVFGQITVDRELFAALDHVLAPAGAVKTVRRGCFRGPGFRGPVFLSDFERQVGVGIHPIHLDGFALDTDRLRVVVLGRKRMVRGERY